MASASHSPLLNTGMTTETLGIPVPIQQSESVSQNLQLIEPVIKHVPSQIRCYGARDGLSIGIESDVDLAQLMRLLLSDIEYVGGLLRVVYAKAGQEMRQALEFHSLAMRPQDEVPVQSIAETFIEA